MPATKKFTASETVRTIAYQVRCMGIPYRELLQKDDRTLRVHFKRGGWVINTDITLNGSDTYDVAVHVTDCREDRVGQPGWLESKTTTFDDVYVEDLADVVNQVNWFGVETDD